MAAVQPTGREVEILVLPSEFTRDRVFLDRFWRDIRVIAELDAKGLLAIEDVGESDGTHYVVYEHIEAETLDAALHRGEMPPPRAVEIAAVLLDALDVAARCELVHGDVKPENVLLCADGGTKLAGLGLARGTGEDASALGERGRIVHYGAPEQILHETRSQRGDIYSVGALLYHMASGRPPMEGQSLGEVQGLVEAHELPRVEDLMNVPENVCEVLKKMLAEDPAERYDAPAAAAKALRDIGL